MATPALLQISAALPASPKQVAAFLLALDRAYTHLRFLEIVEQQSKDEGEGKILGRFVPLGYHYFGREEADLPETFLSPADELILTRANFNSPGFWEFLGSINPLQQIREFLNDRHVRRQDRDYREELEKRKLQLENDKLETELIDKQVELLQKAGYSKPYIKKMLNQHYFGPLAELGEAAMKAGVETAQVEKAPSNQRIRK